MMAIVEASEQKYRTGKQRLRAHATKETVGLGLAIIQHISSLHRFGASWVATLTGTSTKNSTAAALGADGFRRRCVGFKRATSRLVCIAVCSCSPTRFMNRVCCVLQPRRNLARRPHRDHHCHHIVDRIIKAMIVEDKSSIWHVVNPLIKL